MDSSELDAILIDYFKSWRPYRLILARLEFTQGIKRSLSWLKQRLSYLGMRRRVTVSEEFEYIGIVRNCIRRQVRSSNCQMGYRAMWKLLRDKYGLQIKRDIVMLLMRQLDPHGVDLRRSRRLLRRVYFNKGPNFIWHTDGYDKLSHFNLCIHGCIDGFSRKLLWLRVAETNHDPSVILYYFLKAVEKLKGCPSVIWMDRGTENTKVAALQFSLREDHIDEYAGVRSIRFGTSPSNIRIEGFWSMLRRHKTGWWISMLKELEQEGLYNNFNPVHQQCLAIVFLPIIRQELKEYMEFWNSHRIRSSRQGNCIGGIPNDMPAYYGTQNYLHAIDPAKWAYAYSTQCRKPRNIYSPEFYYQCARLCRDTLNLDLQSDLTPDNCFYVYVFLSNSIV